MTSRMQPQRASPTGSRSTTAAKATVNSVDSDAGGLTTATGAKEVASA